MEGRKRSEGGVRKSFAGQKLLRTKSSNDKVLIMFGAWSLVPGF